MYKVDTNITSNLFDAFIFLTMWRDRFETWTDVWIFSRTDKN